MSYVAPPLLHQQVYSLDHAAWVDRLASTENLLIIQDLDGVCMGLVKDPLDRVVEIGYLEATQRFDGHFYVLTNGEHTGKRGMNGIIERSLGGAELAQVGRYYLPGLAAGGVQWQTRAGDISHPGVSEAELAFLAAVPQKMGDRLRHFFEQHSNVLAGPALDQAIQASVLDNMASPTANLNTFYSLLGDHQALYSDLQYAMQTLMEDLLRDAANQGLDGSFFVHYAPNHGRGPDGTEILWFGQGGESGTTDFQFMLRGAIKEAGVLALLNRYYAARTGNYPLGEGFSVRQAPHSHSELLDLVIQAFDPALMPTLVGVGDTVTSVVVTEAGQPVAKRGGSDRNFLHLIQAIGQHFDTGNLVTYVDSSGGELKNRKALKLEDRGGTSVVIEGPGDARDEDDPLVLNVVFPGGYRQYCQAFQTAATQRP
ncbi:glucosylglycerol 3-phosphatase [Nodosilinea sp. LEGE 07298]|uniref:glucosylglycerol 3-phosphatase n=1 Tax=Nodosilinea sp. LEGE 07298 TaxID=2777970 RepID=UPI0018821CFE|nr:glucosylglycerol 3-phosphatase [Nodosilinea sp. LEGE 07298]MBE9112719.1 glucosylglycerol 3-phosphatase [Nodosilinea sp. LEGE 07298]